MLNPQSELYRTKPQITFLLLEAEPDAINGQASHLQDLVDAFLKNSTGILVINTYPSCPSWPLQVLPDHRRILIEKLNAEIIERYQNHPRIQVLDLDGLVAYAGCQNALSPQMMSMARIPFSEAFLKLLARRIVSHVAATVGLSRKCLVLDADNTLWGGIIGEDGLDGIQIGRDWPGREYLEFQKAILELYEQGVILALNSKNNPADVMQVLNEHPQMLLREKHFASIMVNWDPKPKEWYVDTFLMSCRVIGRQVEDALVDRICRDAIEAGCAGISAEYIPSAKNSLVADFWDKMGFTREKSDTKQVLYSKRLTDYKPPRFKYLEII